MLSVAQAEGSREVLGHVGDGSNGGENSLVNRLLVGRLGLGERLLLGLVALEELSLGSVARGRLVLGEVGIVDLCVDL
jgi:hypothetical protein